MRIRQPIYDRLVLLLAAVGLVVFLSGYVSDPFNKAALKFGGGLMLLAYFAVLLENFLSRRSVHTRQGVVHWREGAVRYSLPYIGLACFGAGVALIIFTA